MAKKKVRQRPFFMQNDGVDACYNGVTAEDEFGGNLIRRHSDTNKGYEALWKDIPVSKSLSGARL